jgi:hypothetical protein
MSRHKGGRYLHLPVRAHLDSGSGFLHRWRPWRPVVLLAFVKASE